MPAQKSRKPLFIAIGIALAAAAFAAHYIRKNKLSVVSSKRGDIVEAIYGLGKVKTNHRFEVKLGVISTVKRVYAREGDFVAKGAPLISFEASILFHAPFAGTVTYVANYEGETVMPQVPLLRLEDLKDRFLEVSLEQEAALRVTKGQSAKVSFETLRGHVLNGKVTALFPKDDEFLARISVEGLSDSVVPGMTADVSIEVGQIKDALLIPLKAVSNGSLLVKRDGKRTKIHVQIGHIDGVWAEVKGGDLRPTDEILAARSEGK